MATRRTSPGGRRCGPSRT
ncbi:putative linoleate 9S-lipoxygenase 4 [Iris pallida]|uniref:Linoleate 9S-lipoxygenase 4 n=1 Tax=Iris pallida TaxID=29817 RepID=A0AAX6GCE9_IRIPA|nr:putative linoleate 9S-lipoxygenase 4 [Iris pallida]